VTLLADVVRTSTQVAATSSRLAKTRLIADCLRLLGEDEIEIAIAYLSGEARQGKLALGHATLQSCIGSPAAAPALSLHELDSAFSQLKTIKGSGSATRRSDLLKSIFGQATAEEQDFLLRLIVGELRQGALEGVMLDAVAAAADLPPADVRRAATFAGGIAPAARAALTGGATALAQFSIRLMQPVLPMLAQPAEDVASAMAQLGTAILEWKLDGARVQVHKSGDEVRVYTRNLNDVTVAVPEVVAAVRAARAKELILDGEAIALRADGKPHPFQLTMRRFGRKLDIEGLRGELPLSVFFFDCLYQDGKALVDHPASQRHDLLRKALPPEAVTPSLITRSTEEAQSFYEKALAQGHEGIMAKAMDAAYEAGRRGAGWLKIKRAHTLDLVVLAAEWGHGRRRGWLSNLHLGARDPQSGEYVMLGKTFKGLTDEMLEWQTKAFLALETGRDDWTVRMRPELVVEIAFNDLQESPHYPGGLALRFARVKGYRPDKRPEEADTIDTVRRIFERQGE
jgi:ATP-dependent DNA ligase I